MMHVLLALFVSNQIEQYSQLVVVSWYVLKLLNHFSDKVKEPRAFATYDFCLEFFFIRVLEYFLVSNIR